MPSDVAHYIAWLCILGVCPLLLVGGIRWTLKRGPTVARLNVWIGPALVCLVWLHGTVFDPPNNYAVLHAGSMKSYAPDGRLLSSSPGMSFLGFWFKPFRAMDWSPAQTRDAAVLAAPALVVLLIVLVRARKRSKRASGEGKAAVAYLCWTAAALLLHHIPDFWLDQPGRLLRRLHGDVMLRHALIPGVMAAVLLLAAILLTRATTSPPVESG